MSEYNRHKWAMEWMHGGGRDPHGRGLDEEIKLGKEEWTERQRVAAADWYYVPPKGSNPDWIYYPRNDPGAHKQILEDFDITGETMHAEGGIVPQLVQPGPGRVGFQDGTQINISALGKKYTRRKNPLQAKWQKVLDWLTSLKPGSTINLKDMVANPDLGLTGADDYNTLWTKINSDVKGKGSQVFKDAVKNLKISRTPSYGKAHQLASEFRDLKSTYADELITKIDELTKNPKFKTWQQVEKELIKLFNKAPYNVSKGVAANPFFDKVNKIFRIPNEFQIYGGPFAEGTKLGSQPRTYQSKLKQIIIAKFLENKNKNFEPLRKALEKFYVRDPKKPVNWGHDPDAQKALIRQFIKDVNLTPSKTTPSGKTANILIRFLKQQSYNFKNIFNPVIHILSTTDALEKELAKKGLSQNRKNLLNRELKAVQNQKNALIKRLNRRFNNIFTGDNVLQIEHKIAKMFRDSKATKLPFDYIARGVHVPGRFNQVKYFKFDAPLEGLINKYALPDSERKIDGKKVSRNQVRTKIEALKKDFNKRSNGYLKDVEFKYGKNKVKMIDKTPLFSQLDDADVAKNIAKNVNHSNAYFRSFGNQTIGKHKAKDFIIKGQDINDFIKAASKGNNAFKSSLVLGMEELPWSKIGATAGKVLRGVGLVAAPLDVIPFAQQMERGMGIRSVDTGLARLGEDILNLPHMMEDLTDMIGWTDPDTKSMEKLYEPFEFGRKYSDWVAEGIGDEKRMQSIEGMGLDQKYRDDILYGASGEADMIGELDTEKLKKEALVPLLPEKEETEEIITDESQWLAEGGTVPRTGYKTAGLATKALRVLPWLLGPIDVILEAGMALPALAKGNPRMAKRSTTPGVFGSYGGTMLEDIRKYNRGAYRYAKATKDVNEWNALQEDIEIAEKIIASGEPSQGYEVLRAKQTLAEAKKKQALLEKNFSPTKDDDFQAFQDTMTQMAKDSREWSGDTNWLGQERGKQSTQESLEAEGVKPIDAYMMMQNADTTDEWRKRAQLEELDEELSASMFSPGLDVETFLDPYGLKTQDLRYSDLPTDIASDYGSWEANQVRQKLEQLQNIDPGVAYAQGGIAGLLKK